MTNTQPSYKVLWVDDDESIIDSFCLRADNVGIDLDVAADWETAEQKLKANFCEYSAIILDANCKLKKNDPTPSEFFLGNVMAFLSNFFGKKGNSIPWYILSAGTMNNFGTIIGMVNTDIRKEMVPEWGELIYLKDNSSNSISDLFNNIIKVGAQKSINKVIARHHDALQYVGSGKLIDYDEARTYLLKMLSALYFPEENQNFTYEGNPLRKVLEYLFRTAYKYGLLPDEYVNTQGHLMLLDCSRFMGGKEMKCYEGNTLKYKMRYSEEGETIFNEEVAKCVQHILNFASADSHTSENESYLIEEDKHNLFFSYVLQLCHVIKWFGKYVETNPDREENRGKHRMIPLTLKEEEVTVVNLN